MYPNNAVRVENVAKTFGAKSQSAPARAGRRALNGVSFDVARGEIFGVLGANGSGKSTLLRLMAGALTPDSGRISVFGHDTAAEPRAVQGLINRAALDSSFFKKLSPVENLLHSARLGGVRPGETRRRVLEMLARLGVSETELNRPIEELSRGAQQKVALARACLGEPRLLLLDEPTAGLDPRSRRTAQALLRELRDQHGATLVLATQDLNEAETLCDRVAILDEGRLVAVDTLAALKRLAAPAPNDPAPSLEDVYLELTSPALDTEEVIG